MNEVSIKLWKKARRYRWIFALCPYIKEVFIVNSLARGEASPTSDIDLLIITEKSKVREVRLVLSVLTQLVRMRVHGAHRAGRFCLSFLADEHEKDLKKLFYHDDTFLPQFKAEASLLYAHKKSLVTDVVRLIVRLLIACPWFVHLHTARAVKRAEKHFKNASIVISPTVFKFHENDVCRHELL